MENTKVVSVIGYERADLPFFLSLALKEKRLRVLVIDNSCSHDLYTSLKRPDEITDHVEFDRAIYMRNKTIDLTDTSAFEKFDVVIIYHGMNVDYELLSISNITVLMTNYEPVQVTNITEYIDMDIIDSIPKEYLYVVYRDRVGGKISEQYILKKLGLKEIEQEMVIYHDESDYEAYINFCYNGSHSMKGISSEFKNTINALRAACIGEELKNKNKKKKGGEEQ